MADSRTCFLGAFPGCLPWALLQVSCPVCNTMRYLTKVLPNYSPRGPQPHFSKQNSQPHSRVSNKHVSNLQPLHTPGEASAFWEFPPQVAAVSFPCSRPELPLTLLGRSASGSRRRKGPAAVRVRSALISTNTCDLGQACKYT